DCSVNSVTSPPLPDHAKAAPKPQPRGGRGAPARDLPTPWAAFRNVEPPPLAADDYAVDNGPNASDAVGMRAYAWGKRGSDWTRNGRWLIRFDDRFDPAGGLRQTAVTASPWAHEADAVEGVGTQPNYGTSAWRGHLDPSGRALLARACHDGRTNACSLYSAADGQPVLPIKSPSMPNGFPYVFDPSGAVRVGETWFFLTPSPTAENAVALWRADLGVARVVGTYFRTVQRYSTDWP